MEMMEKIYGWLFIERDCFKECEREGHENCGYCHHYGVTCMDEDCSGLPVPK